MNAYLHYNRLTIEQRYCMYCHEPVGMLGDIDHCINCGIVEGHTTLDDNDYIEAEESRGQDE